VNRQKITPSVKQILTLISDDHVFALLRTVALLATDSRTLKDIEQLTRNQYYARTHNLITCGLIMRKDGKYCLTPFGKVVYNIRLRIAKAVNNLWRLNVLDTVSAQGTNDESIKELYPKLVNLLIQDVEMKKLLNIPNSILRVGLTITNIKSGRPSEIEDSKRNQVKLILDDGV
jgi:hypothetical protein